MNKLPAAVPEKLADQYREQMKKDDLVFINENNIERMKAIVEPRVMEEIEKELALKKAEALAPKSLEEKENA